MQAQRHQGAKPLVGETFRSLSGTPFLLVFSTRNKKQSKQLGWMLTRAGLDPCMMAQHAVNLKKMTDPRKHRKSAEAILYEIYNREFRRKNTRIFTFHSYSSCWSEFL